MGRRQSPILGGNRLKLGFFSPNCSGGMAVTKVAERWQNSWDNNIRLAQLGDEAGIEFVLPIARWIGYGGETDFHGSVLETLTWATGLLAHTRRINIFATVHTAFIHPVVAAKQLATADQLGKGRLGLECGRGMEQAGIRRIRSGPSGEAFRSLCAGAGVVRCGEAHLEARGTVRLAGAVLQPEGRVRASTPL